MATIGPYEDIDPTDGVIDDAPIIAVVNGVPHAWDGTDWSIVKWPPAPHIPSHEKNGSDEAIVEKLGTEDTTATDYFEPDGTGGVTTAAFKHDIDNATKHGGVAGAEDDIAALNANKLVKSSGKKFPLDHNEATEIDNLGADDHHDEIHDHDTHTNIGVDDHHAKVHTIVSHDTTATGANLTTLTDGSDADALHIHPDYGKSGVPVNFGDVAVAFFEQHWGYE